MKVPPSPDELPIEDQQALLNGKIAKVEQVGDEWRDDHIDCVAIRVHFEDREPIETSLWWCGPVIIGALKYMDESPRAKADVLHELRSNISDTLECAEAVD